MKENFIKSNMNMTEKDKAKSKKLRDTKLRKRERERKVKAKKKAEKAKAKSDDKSEQVKDVGGRPPKFETPELLETAIKGYIENCPDTQERYTPDGVAFNVKIPTISGLAYFLGFESRQSMYDYEHKDDRFSYTIKRARLWMEKHYEQLAQGKTPAGAIFALKNMGWKEKSEVKHSGETIHKNVELSKEEYMQAREQMINNDEC